MGEIAEMMLDGTLCEGCGEYIGRGDMGFPQYCSRECARDRGALEAHDALQGTRQKADPNSNRSKKRKANRFRRAVAERGEHGRQ